MNASPHLIRLHTPSQRRHDFYTKWRLERQLEQKLAQFHPPGNTLHHEGVLLHAISVPYNRCVEEGDIRLLPTHLAPDSNALIYIAVVHIRDNGTAVVAPFSRYSTPCCKDEWFTGLAAAPLKVLQLWNAMPTPVLAIAQTWRTGHLSEEQLDAAKRLYGHFLQGTFPKGELRENIGLAITSPKDERLHYQEDEHQHLDRLLEKLFGFIARQKVQGTER